MRFRFYPILLGLTLPASAALRPLSTDRPDTTESAYTVDAGHFQFEMELATWAHDGGASEFSFMELNAKIGLSHSTDLQVVLPFFTHEEGGAEGFGDIEMRLKWNLWGNDSGSTALALMPFIKLPTAHGDLGNDKFEGGLIVPLAFEGPAGWSCAVMAEVDLALDDDGDGYHPELLTSATASHDLNDCTAMFVELVSVLNTESGDSREAYFNTGLTWQVAEMWQMDGGVRVGLTDASTDFTPFVGASTKF